MRHVLGHQNGFHLPIAIVAVSKIPEVEALDFSSEWVNGGVGVGRRFGTNGGSGWISGVMSRFRTGGTGLLGALGGTTSASSVNPSVYAEYSAVSYS